MSGQRMDRHRAIGVLTYNYGGLTLNDDPDWAEEMVEMLTEKSTDGKRSVCSRYGLKYPPKEFWDDFFGNDAMTEVEA